MRLWDVCPGYLNDRSLLGEHRELHAMVAVLRGAGAYAHHPETLRWRGFGWALARRHRQLAAEMALRGFSERTPVRLRAAPGRWPPAYVDPPARQYDLLRAKYRDRPGGRIPLPRNAQALWAQHKYSVLARDPARYRDIGRRAARPGGDAAFAALAAELVELLRSPPRPGPLVNALHHMWGHVSQPGADPAALPPGRLLALIQRRAQAGGEPYLLASTALSELAAWL